jgi:putative ABC transport system permease protein
VAETHGWGPGDRAQLWLSDGAATDLRVAAVFDDRLGLPELFLPWSLAEAHSTTPAPDAVYLALGPRADDRAIQAAVAPVGGTVRTTAA